jgi:anti-sigma B factor antagonist
VKTASPILFANLATVVWIRIDAKGSFEISAQLRDFVTRKIELGKTRFVLDLDRSPGMDSTFMGTLLGISKEVSSKPEGLLDVVNANARNVQLLKNLGLTSMLSLDEKGERWNEERRQVGCILAPCDESPQSKRATAHIMLEAHEALADAQPENAARFEDVIHFLKADLQATSAS